MGFFHVVFRGVCESEASEMREWWGGAEARRRKADGREAGASRRQGGERPLVSLLPVLERRPVIREAFPRLRFLLWIAWNSLEPDPTGLIFPLSFSNVSP